MPDDKQKPMVEELDFGEGLVCDPETGVCEIPKAGVKKPGVVPLPLDKPGTEKGDR